MPSKYSKVSTTPISRNARDKILILCWSSVLLLLLLLPASTVTAATTSSDNLIEIEITDANPTYLQLCLTWNNSPSTVAHSVQISSYDWDNNKEDPQKGWYDMTIAPYNPKCWYFGAPNAVSFIYAPTSFQISKYAGSESSSNTADPNKIVLKNVLRSLAPLKLIFNETALSNGSVVYTSVPLTHNLTDNGTVKSYSAGATYFDPNPPYACKMSSVPEPYNELYAAIRVQDWKNSEVCGQCLRLCNSSGFSVEVMVVDQCPNGNPCTRYNWLDISPKAFQLLSNNHLEWGIQQLGWRYVRCSAFSAPNHRNMGFTLSDWSADYGFELQVVNYTMGLRSISLRANNSNTWHSLTRTNFNTWTYNTGGPNISCPCLLKLESIVGETVVESHVFTDRISSLPMSPHSIAGTVQFSQVPEAYDPPSNEPCYYTVPGTTDTLPSASNSQGNDANGLHCQSSILFSLLCLVVISLVTNIV